MPTLLLPVIKDSAHSVRDIAVSMSQSTNIGSHLRLWSGSSALIDVCKSIQDPRLSFWEHAIVCECPDA